MKFCVLAASAARARFFTLHSSANGSVPPLNETCDLVNTFAQLRDNEAFSNSRPGSRQAGGGVTGHAVDDRRDTHRDEELRRFSADVIKQLSVRCDELGSCRVIICASPTVLSDLRHQLDRRSEKHRERFPISEINKEVSNLSPSQLHDYLADKKLLPPRIRATH